ncbi:hypothetical protein H0H87_002229 [Tephrocybe sp. NHM501043]|nr:hypothetical protein H0H87_002229 [Tephrocybe sp. NHM501043]
MLLARAIRIPPSRNLISRTAKALSSLETARMRGAVVDVHPEVEDALATGKPVVALETALITHGFPYPASLELSLSLETIVRSQGSIPATIGLIDGRVKIGLEKEEFERLASREKSPAKISRRDIAAAMALKSDGGHTTSLSLRFSLANTCMILTGTTCSATLIFAALAGIKIFATGGLGGVHRGGESCKYLYFIFRLTEKQVQLAPAMDVSADLGELTRCPVALVSAGVKSILDIPRTLEYLETLGVPVLTYGPSQEFPAFFSRHSGAFVPWNVDDPVKAAKILHHQWQLGMDNGVVFAVPIPNEYEEAGATIQQAVDQAVAESVENGVSKLGKDVTPWLLSRVGELTQGTSRASNIALLENTALVAPLIVIGSSAVDISAQALGDNKVLTARSTAPGHVSLSLGGVARNIAEASHRLLSASGAIPRLTPVLVSPIGDDAFGRLLIKETTELGMRVDGFVQSSKPTAVCNMVIDSNGDLIGGIADMDIVKALKTGTVIPHIERHKPRFVAVDGNLSPETIKGVVGRCNKDDIQELASPVFFEPTSVTKSTAVFPAVVSSLEHFRDGAPIAFISPNTLELSHIFSYAESFGLTSHSSWWQTMDDLSLGTSFRSDLERLARINTSDRDPSRGTLAFVVEKGIAQMAVKLLPFFQHLIIKCGERGVFVVMRISGASAATSSWTGLNTEISQRRIIAHGKTKGNAVVLQHFPPQPLEKLVNVTGAGDSFVGALLASLVHDPRTFHHPDTLANAIMISQQAALLSLKSALAVSPHLSNMLPRFWNE